MDVLRRELSGGMIDTRRCSMANSPNCSMANSPRSFFAPVPQLGKPGLPARKFRNGSFKEDKTRTSVMYYRGNASSSARETSGNQNDLKSSSIVRKDSRETQYIVKTIYYVKRTLKIENIDVLCMCSWVGRALPWNLGFVSGIRVVQQKENRPCGQSLNWCQSHVITCTPLQNRSGKIESARLKVRCAPMHMREIVF